ncbi:patched domain-containing protein 3-like [Eriocheir sinensis]|uniref:patched domain-containing protein 3-like n=1 Tax=Eriocheir sinensis TaxID=95602 RepID=UPI0021C999D6|nr:patched domain-containing protein 3-like [Eriocheir sinensis]XP_050730488.1 patched domain-containing protein 3-like [Eriocheir sinensis]XP_050730489.1 patched domain-containing protein 3-like [Eriocheir sinensis]XP_050730490.1 patched domain-containing protein 3-like [Eriocheir sinensis]
MCPTKQSQTPSPGPPSSEEGAAEGDTGGGGDAHDEDKTKTGQRGGRSGALQPVEETSDEDVGCLSRVSGSLTLSLEDFFEQHGRRVAAWPGVVVLCCLALTFLSAAGFLFFTKELRPFRLWLPQESEFIKVLDWQVHNFPSNYRRHLAVWEADNVLEAEVVQEMWRLHVRVSVVTAGPNHTTWPQLCARVPTMPGSDPAPDDYDYEDFDYGVLGGRRRRRQAGQVGVPVPREDLSLSLPREQYCDSLSMLPKACLETGLLEVWGHDEEAIMALTDQQVIDDVNAAHLSLVFGYQFNVTRYLGSVTRNASGHVVAAAAATQVWVSALDQAAVAAGEVVVDQGNGELVDAAGFAWEQAWVETVLNTSARLPAGVRVFAQAASSFGKVSDDNIWGDVKWLVVGMVAMSVFVNGTLGRRNLVQQRPLLAGLGLLSVYQAVVISYGLCSLLGVPYCPVNSILPILLLGLGVDDMFVIMAAWEAEGGKDLSRRAGRAMRHAGVAITVTSLTDVTAFAVGATTALPALRSFCLYASVGILSVYVMQATFFLAWLVKDEQRLEANKNGLLWCVTHHDWSPRPCSQWDLLAATFRQWSRLLLSTPCRVFVLFFSGGLLACSAWASTNLHQEFDPSWFIPSSSYLYDTFRVTGLHFPEAGEQGYVYFANVSLPEDLPELNRFVDALVESQVVTEVNAWFTTLMDYMAMQSKFDNTTLTYAVLQDTLSLFLQSSSGASYRQDFTIDGALDCRRPAPPIISFRIGITHRPAQSPAAQAAALSTIQSLVSAVPVGGYRAAWAQAYCIWETNQVVGTELLRNVLAAGVVVGVVTLVLLASAPAALLVLAAVAATVTGVTGVMWAWGLTIDTVSCIAIVLSIGLSVDYAAHVAHAFLAARQAGGRKARARAALEGVGPAVLLGGLSTMLSFVVLVASTSHVFITFFKVFTAASAFGLYYGLVLLPVILSFIGPPAYPAPACPDKGAAHHHTNDAFTPDTPSDRAVSHA